MIVRRQDFEEVVARFSKHGLFGLDTETTGLRRKDRLFSIILSDEADGYYFNFQPYKDLGEEWILPREWINQLAPVWGNPEATWFIHNAKFDMGMLAKEGVQLEGSIHCTEAVERVVKNNYLGHKPYSLKACALRRGWAKDEKVEEYIKEHGLITKLQVPGKDKAVELWHFDRVPWQVMFPYGVTDAKLHRAIGIDQIKALKERDEARPMPSPSCLSLYHNERKLMKACYRVEETGMKINRDYVRRAMTYTQGLAEQAKRDFQAKTGLVWDNGTATIVEAFRGQGIELPKTRTGKPCTNKQVLEDLENPVADLIRGIRQPEKLISTYYSSFLYFADENDVVHANMRVGGTETSRFSYSDPNLQNLPKEDEPEDREKPFHVRGSFVPLSDEWCFVPIDFRQQEFRMMLDYAGEIKLIEAINAGADVHEATAQLCGITRKQAKTINFGLLYGMGTEKLARALGITVSEAQNLKCDYFAKLPKVQTFINTVRDVGASRGYIWNWAGFRNHIANPEWAYILPNHLIQGGCAQVVRFAMSDIEEMIVSRKLRSRVIAQVHDELLFQVHRSELDIVPEFQKTMEGIYKPRNGMRLDCSVEHSWKSWSKWDQKKGAPTLPESTGV